MQRTDTEIEQLLENLITSTRSPRGKYSAANSYFLLEKRLFGSRRFLLPKRIFGIAATAAILCLSVWMAFNYFQPATLQTISTLAETRIIRLPDGTSVTLNHFSSLTYPEKFKGKERQVVLNGEAYFEVFKDKVHPFIVKAEAVHIEVLGTHFNVNAYRNNPSITTTLLEGSVAVSNDDHTMQMILKPNEIAIYNKEKKTFTRKFLANANEEIAWCSGEMIFNHLPLQEIVRRLSNSFGVSIHIADNRLQSYCITARFSHREDLKTILSLLGETGHFNYSINQKQITITAKPDIQ